MRLDKNSIQAIGFVNEVKYYYSKEKNIITQKPLCQRF